MRTFTKIFLASVMAVVSMTGFGASLKAKVNNEGLFIPKAPALSAVDKSAGNSYRHLVFGRNASLAGNEWSMLKSFSASLSLPKRTFNGFTANASNTVILSLNPAQANLKPDEGRMKPSLNAFPNPSKGKFTISLSQASEASYKITLSNTIGHVIKVIEVHPQYHSYIIDLSDKPAGVYFYSLSVNNKLVETKRLILQQ